MKRSRCSEERPVHALRQAEAGAPAVEVCRELGVNEQAFSRWRRRFAGLSGATKVVDRLDRRRCCHGLSNPGGAGPTPSSYTLVVLLGSGGDSAPALLPAAGAGG